MIGASGSAVLAASSVVGTSGAPIRLFQVTILSDGTAGVVTIHNGTDTDGQEFVIPTCVISKSVTVQFGEEGLLFPAGCYYEADAHAIRAVLTYREEHKAS